MIIFGHSYYLTLSKGKFNQCLTTWEQYSLGIQLQFKSQHYTLKNKIINHMS
jgi:hypothetical protein